MKFELAIEMDNPALSAMDIALQLRKIADRLSQLHDNNNSASPREWKGDDRADFIFENSTNVGTWEFTKRRFHSEDGYIFYLQSDGKLTDTWDPEHADWEYSSLEELRAAVDIEEVLR